MKLSRLQQELKLAANPKQAKLLQRFFKTGPGEYGHGDIFLGIMVPIQRKITEKYIDLSLTDIQRLLNNKIHEHRFCALAILVSKYKKANESEKKKIFNFYIKNSKKINNWDLVDVSAPKIVGGYLLNKNKTILYKLARSKNIWQKRISILATFWFIRENKFKDSLEISKILLGDKHDLIHKAVGWMIREIGKRNKQVEIKFLAEHAHKMPRVMLRYAIEKFTPNERHKYLKKESLILTGLY
ncbi:MAG: DNA alkylation repair protein [Minisyncoccota bacterium]